MNYQEILRHQERVVHQEVILLMKAVVVLQEAQDNSKIKNLVRDLKCT
jgi:hypothetical protein